jgi:hypothetical protein
MVIVGVTRELPKLRGAYSVSAPFKRTGYFDVSATLTANSEKFCDLFTLFVNH